MKFTWKPIKNINNLPRGVEIMVCIKDQYCEYIRRDDSLSDDPDAWFYVYTQRQVQDHKVKAFTHYFIPRPFKVDNTK
jgi:hypothetical protein